MCQLLIWSRPETILHVRSLFRLATMRGKTENAGKIAIGNDKKEEFLLQSHTKKTGEIIKGRNSFRVLMRAANDRNLIFIFCMSTHSIFVDNRWVVYFMTFHLWLRKNTPRDEEKKTLRMRLRFFFFTVEGNEAEMEIFVELDNKFHNVLSRAKEFLNGWVVQVFISLGFSFDWMDNFDWIFLWKFVIRKVAKNIKGKLNF